MTAAAHLRLLSDAPPPGEEERPEARLGLEEELRLGLAARSWRRSSRCTFGIAASKNSGVGAVRGRGMVWSCLLEPYRVNTKTLTTYDVILYPAGHPRYYCSIIKQTNKQRIPGTRKFFHI